MSLPVIHLQLLGMPVIRLDETIITFYLKKADALFFYMCVEKNSTRTHLASLLWGDQPEAAARKNLRNALYAIKQTLGFDPFESPKKQILRLNSDITFEIDTDVFLKLGDPELYRGEFLSGFSLKDSYEYDEWMNSYRSRCLDCFLQQLNRRFLELPESDVSGREDIFHRYIVSDPMNENIYLQMISTYKANGQYLKGIRCYEELASLLKEELGVTPSPEAKKLYHDIAEIWNSSEETPAVGRSRFLIGRDKEMGILIQSWHNLQMGRGGTIFVTGSKGIGKTYLCDCFLDDISQEHVLILRADCPAQENRLPLNFWSDILSRMMKFITDTSLNIPSKHLKAIHSCFPYLEMLDGLASLEQDLSATVNHRAARNSILRIFELIGESIPVILYINDITNMDPLSADWLAALIRQNKGSLFVLATCQSDPGPEWEEYTGKLVCVRNVIKLILNPLDISDVAPYLSGRLGVDSLPEERIRAIYNECRGNPFYLDVVADYLATQNKQPVIAKAYDILNSRLATLPRDERRLLDLISLFPDYASSEPLLFITGTDPMDLVDMLDILVCREFLTEDKIGNRIAFRFRYPQMKELVRSLLSSSKERLYHRRIAEFLEQEKVPKDSRWYSQLIFHFREGGMPAKSLYYRILQFEAFSKMNYNLYPVLSLPAGDAVNDTETVLDELYSMETELSEYYAAYPDQIFYEEASCRLTLIIGRICIQQGRYDTALEKMRAELSNNRYLKADRELLRAYHRQIVFYGIQTWNLPVMNESIMTCLKTDEETSDPLESAVDHRLMGLYLNMCGDYAESDKMLNRSIMEFKSSPLSMPSYTFNLAACYNYLGENARKRNDYETAVAFYRKAIDICRKNKKMDNPTFYVNLARTYISQGKYSIAADTIRNAEKLYESLNVQMSRSLCYILKSSIEHRMGNTTAAREALVTAKETYFTLSSPRDEVYYYLTCAMLKAEAPSDYMDLLPEEPAVYRKNALTVLDSYVTLKKGLEGLL